MPPWTRISTNILTVMNWGRGSLSVEKFRKERVYLAYLRVWTFNLLKFTSIHVRTRQYLREKWKHIFPVSILGNLWDSISTSFTNMSIKKKAPTTPRHHQFYLRAHKNIKASPALFKSTQTFSLLYILASHHKFYLVYMLI
jgi:hypothetical protein